MARISATQRNLAIGVALTVALIAVGGLAAVFPSASNQGYMPEQPIPFSHKVHAGDNKIACLYCHSNAEKARHSGIPSMNVCMNCHTVVKADSPHIQLLQKMYKEGKAFEWVRIHELPDHAYFNHKRHLAKGLVCENCHGDVKSMDRVYQFSPLTMGWCMECHRGRTTPRQVMENIYPGEKNPQGHAAPTNCSTCHN
ncbi:MAG: cytochrome c family protein [Oligoflexia bacterium]|nr:cytochrome c family protein [Oligoflexia bacterium]